jgi:A/G-specific adenine glycosylase
MFDSHLKHTSAPRLSPQKISGFRRIIYRFYEQSGREFAWRKTTDPYRILVSEFMLQQTQTERVEKYYARFLRKFPSIRSLATSSLRDVLEVWQGLGYNRRAKALRETARIVVAEHGGRIPSDAASLMGLPGVGPATASAIAAFAFNQPAALLETNIRRVFIHFFFPGREAVKDSEILPLLEATLDRADPRSWHYALMDYGVMLKKAGLNANRRSAHYQKQAAFKSSNRELRGLILKALLSQRKMTKSALLKMTRSDAEKADEILARLEDEGFITRAGKWLALAEK